MKDRLRLATPELRHRLVMTRQGALAAATRLYPQQAVAPSRRLAFTFLGSILIGLAVALVIHARLGLPPYDVLLSAVARRTPLSHGQSGWAVGLVLLAVAALLGRRANLLTVVYILANGITVDVGLRLINDAEQLPVRLSMVIVGMGLLALGIGFVVHGGLTGGAFDLLMQAGEERGGNATTVRTSIEVSAVVIGIAMGGSVGIATLLFAFGIGPLLTLVLQAMADHRVGREHRLEDAGV